jgi:hypothetical protein
VEFVGIATQSIQKALLQTRTLLLVKRSGGVGFA